MPKIEDGGPAFPRSMGETTNNYDLGDQGMALRDWFAGQALSGLLAADVEIAQAIPLAYKAADGMIRQRNKISN